MRTSCVADTMISFLFCNGTASITFITDNILYPVLVDFFLF